MWTVTALNEDYKTLIGGEAKEMRSLTYLVFIIVYLPLVQLVL